MPAYIYTYDGEDFRVQMSHCVMGSKNVSVSFFKLNLSSFEFREMVFSMTEQERQAFYSTQVSGGLGSEVLDNLIDWAAQNVKDKIVLDYMEPPQGYVSPQWTKV